MLVTKKMDTKTKLIMSLKLLVFGIKMIQNNDFPILCPKGILIKNFQSPQMDIFFKKSRAYNLYQPPEVLTQTSID
jgi:hypothetical protein